MSADGTAISHIVLLGDALGDLPRIRDRGPGHLENRLLPDWDAPWRLSLVRADDVVNRSPLGKIPADASHLVITLEGNRAISSSGLLEGRPDSYEQALARLSFAADQFEQVVHGLVRTAQQTGLPAAMCTMFPPCHRDPVKQRATSTALSIFNDRIVRQAVDANLPVVDMRSAGTEEGDYTPSGLLSRAGLTKAATLIWQALHESRQDGARTEIFRL